MTILGLLCKPSIITVGLMLLVIGRWMLGREWRSSVVAVAPWIVLAIPFTLLTQHAQPFSSDWAVSVWQRPFVAGVLDRAGRIDEAIAQYRQAIAIDPNVDILHFGLGSDLFKSGDRNGGIAELELAARLGPTAVHHDQLGVAYATVGNMTAARREFEAAVKVDPHYAPALKHIAMSSGR